MLLEERNRPCISKVILHLMWIAVIFSSLECVRCMCPAESPDGSECPFISDKDVERMFKSLRNVTQLREALDMMLIAAGVSIDPSSKVSDISLLRRHWMGPDIYMYEISQLPFYAVTSALVQNFNLTARQIQELLPLIPMVGPYSKQAQLDCSKAFPTPQCDPISYPYREFDGTCNNLQHPLWGSTNTCAKRLLPAHYTRNDGFRESVTAGPLPSPRSLSLNVHSSISHPSTGVTHLFVFFGQFLAHDLSQTPISVTAVNRTLDCCLVEKDLYPQCSAIPIPPDDPFYSQYEVNCINFVRSAICPTCTLGERQQINEITAFIDGSVIYGNHQDEIDYLKANDGTGRLRSVKTAHGEILPESRNPHTDQCSFLNTSKICFEVGDARGNQHTTLTSLHILFMREHNRIADRLKELNSQWNDERIFQETRRIVGAELQSIAYGEWLPVILDSDRMSELSLTPLTSGYTDYDPGVDPSVFTEFSTAVLRFGHSLVNKVVAEYPGNETRLMRDDFFKPFELQNGVLGPRFTGPAQQPCQWFGRNMVPDLTNFLYRRFLGQPGLDLAAINIHRGRDHGLPPYTEIVQFCSEYKTKIQSFDDLVDNGLMSPGNANLLKENYRHVDDIDLWTGMLSETPIETSTVGPTGACILGKQFHNLKFGDRFFFEHGNQVGSFTKGQLQELRKVTLSKIICENTEVLQIPKSIFHFINENNPYVNCQNLGQIDLTLWKE